MRSRLRILSEKAEEYLLFSQKNIKKVEEKACGFEHFFVFLQPICKKRQEI